MSAEQLMTPELQAWLDHVHQQWSKAGITALERARLRRDLEHGVLDALACGAQPADLMRDDPASVGRDMAQAHGLTLTAGPTPAATFATVARTALLGAAGGAAAAWVLVLSAPWAGGVTDSWTVLLILYALAGIVALACVILALRRQFHAHTQRSRITWIGLTGVLLGSAVAVAPSMAIAKALDYPTSIPLMVPEIIVAAACLLAGTWITWQLGRRVATPTA